MMFMGKKKNKKVNPRKERYAKFKKDRPKVMNITSPDPSPDEIKHRQEDEMTINRFLRFSKNPFTKTIKERKAKSK